MNDKKGYRYIPPSLFPVYHISHRCTTYSICTDLYRVVNLPLKPPAKRLCHNPFLSLRATKGSVAISFFPMHYEIASVVSLPRNDITTQSLSWWSQLCYAGK
jgi:hypothetical protein